MKPTLQAVICLFLMIIYQCKGQDISGLSPEIIEDIYDFYFNRTIRDREPPNHHVEVSEIKYFLTTKDNYNGTQINSQNINLINKTNPLIILIHGWIQDVNTSWYELMRDAYFNRSSDVSVLLVDYSKYSQQEYFSAVYDSQFVGKFIGEFLVELIRHSIPRKNMLVIGHSLGGHIAGFSGQTFFKILGKKLYKVLALDPAGPAFQLRPADQRLDKTDAERVHVIHTGAGIFGMVQPCGHIDFYPNGGSYQVGCSQQNLPNLDIIQIIDYLFCPHISSWQYFAKTINDPKAYLGRNCLSWIGYPLTCNRDTEYMGNLDSNKTGKYYLRIGTVPFEEFASNFGKPS